jgi:hypothetical protein
VCKGSGRLEPYGPFNTMCNSISLLGYGS